MSPGALSARPPREPGPRGAHRLRGSHRRLPRPGAGSRVWGAGRGRQGSPERAGLSAVMRTGESGLTVFRLLTKRAGWLWVQSNARLLFRDGRPDGIVARQRALT